MKTVTLFSDPHIVCAFSLGRSHNMSFTHGSTFSSLTNRREFLSGLGIDFESVVCGQQVHGDRVQRVGIADKGRGAKSKETAFADTDALITNEKGVPIAIFTADCLSVFLFDPMSRSVGVAHAGWRSSKAQIVAKAVGMMQSEFGARPENMRAGFGPAISSCCYDVGPEFRETFPESVVEREDRLFLDLVDVNRRQLISCGVKSDNIAGEQACTSCNNDTYFSYRKEGATSGRMMSVAMLR